MNTFETGSVSGFEWASAGQAIDGEAVSGDGFVICEVAGSVLFAVIDGIGHGPKAAAATARAISSLQSGSHGPKARIQACHEALVGTRGAVLSVAVANASARILSWAGVGNVECVLVHRERLERDAAPIRGGVVGYQLPVLREATVTFDIGDTLVFATDGIDDRFLSAVRTISPPEEVARAIVAHHRRGNDDALALVARFRGTP